MTTWSTASWDDSVRWIRSAARGAVLLGLSVVPFASPAVAQDPNLIDQGRYDVRVGERSGTEVFAIRRQGEGFMAVGRLQLEGAGAWLRSGEIGLRTDASFAPIRYETRAVGTDHSLIAIRTGTRVRITTSDEEGDRMSELLANPDHVLLSPGVAQHYYFVVRRLEAGGNPVALFPTESAERPIRLVDRREDTVEVAGTAVPAIRWELAIGDSTHLVWSDPNDGRILRVEVPGREWRSVRQAD